MSKTLMQGNPLSQYLFEMAGEGLYMTEGDPE